MNVLVFAGFGVDQSSLNRTVSAFKSLLYPNYCVQTIHQQPFTSHSWASTCALLILPECCDLLTPSAIATVKAFVENGGTFLFLANGVRSTHFNILDILPGSAKDSPLQIFDKTTRTYVSHGAGEPFDIETWVGSPLYRDGVAAVRCSIGAGKANIWRPYLAYTSQDDISPSTSAPTEGSVTTQERKTLMQAVLKGLGLHLPSKHVQVFTRPLPQFLTSHPSKPFAVSKVMENLAAPSPASDLSVFRDENDCFTFYPLAESAEVFHRCHTGSTIGISDPKHIIVCLLGQLPSPDHTHLFDLHTYYAAVSEERNKNSLVDTLNSWGMGEVVLYGQVVTSTQTMLDKNPRFLSSVPTPLLSLSSHQLSGRGRGTNVWLSPPGCLQFSLLLRVSLSCIPASRLVFVQYLFGLAVTEACRDDAVLGVWGKDVRLKWPNDLYAVLADETDGRKKVGGILVNTNFRGDIVDIVIGCGLNLFTSPPLLSLSHLLPSEGCSITMERTLAIIMAKFEGMWSTFTAHHGSFDPFMDLYLSRWLHSDELVTLTTTDPPMPVRIAGITKEGLLRTTPERMGWMTGNQGFIDLQPDGNSFDLMAGLIRTKT